MVLVYLSIRPETESDYEAITEVNELAFGQPAEGKLVENLRKNPRFITRLSLVAEINEKVVGHILFFPVKIESVLGDQKAIISLAPMAVLPEFQKKGIGGELIKQGLESCYELGYDSVIVLGHPEYYPKFGFRQAHIWNIKDPFNAPAEAYMAIELKKGALDNISGVVEYPDEFFALQELTKE